MSSDNKSILKRTNNIQRLTKEQREQPELVFNLFFNDVSLNGARQDLMEWLTCAMANDTCYFQDGRDRANLIFFYVRLELLMEAAYVMLMKNKWYKDKYNDMANEAARKIKYL